VDFNRRDEYSGQWNLALQAAPTRNFSVQAAYVGSRGLKLFSARNINEFDPSLGQRPVPEAGLITYSENAGRSAYHALQLSANRRFAQGLTFDLYYTWARVMAYYNADALGTPVNSVLQDPLNIAADYGPKVSDFRHRFTSVLSYGLPLSRLSGSSAFRRAIFDGWSAQTILSMDSGQPLNVLAGRDLAGVQRTTGQRPDSVSGVDPYVRDMQSFRWLTPSAFDLATPVRERRYGNLGYNALYGPGSVSMDAALHKQFRIREGQSLVFRLEMFNAMNHMNPSNPNNNTGNPNFGLILSGSGGRNVQLGLKYSF
jgi:hypothetical protein